MNEQIIILILFFICIVLSLVILYLNTVIKNYKDGVYQIKTSLYINNTIINDNLDRATKQLETLEIGTEEYYKHQRFIHDLNTRNREVLFMINEFKTIKSIWFK